MTSARKLALLLAQADPIAAAPTWRDKGAVAEALIDRAAGAVRCRFLTDIPGQDGVYQWKAAEASALLAARSAGQPIVPVAYPHLSAEVGITAETLEAVADVIHARGELWRTQASPAIEGARLAAKAAARSAADAEDEAGLRAALAVSWPHPA